MTLGNNSLLEETITSDELNTLTSGLDEGNPVSSYVLSATLTGGNNVVVAGLLSNITVDGGGNNKFVIEDPTLLGVPSGTTLSAAVYQYGGTFTGSGGSDQFYFVGGSGAASFGNVVLNEQATGSATIATTDTLDFSNFQGGEGVNLNLNVSGPQQLNPQLTLTLPTTQVFSKVVGSPGNDTITASSVSQTITGAALDVSDSFALAAVPPSDSIGSDTTPGTNPDFPAASPGAVQWVYLDFTTFTTPVESIADGQNSLPPLGGTDTPTVESMHNEGTDSAGMYSAADQAAILADLESDYALFGNVSFTLTQPSVANHETVYFDVTPMVADGKLVAGRRVQRDRLPQPEPEHDDGRGRQRLPGGMTQGQVADSEDSAWVNLTVTVTAHELGHTLGLRHEDSLGPIGFGISSPPGDDAYFPSYTGYTGAFTTDDNIIASPASVGSSLADAASGQDQFGAREAIKLAFITDGTVVDGTAPWRRRLHRVVPLPPRQWPGRREPRRPQLSTCRYMKRRRLPGRIHLRGQPRLR